MLNSHETSEGEDDETQSLFRKEKKKKVKGDKPRKNSILKNNSLTNKKCYFLIAIIILIVLAFVALVFQIGIKISVLEVDQKKNDQTKHGDEDILIHSKSS